MVITYAEKERKVHIALNLIDTMESNGLSRVDKAEVLVKYLDNYLEDYLGKDSEDAKYVLSRARLREQE